ncbi:MAG: 3-phosphoshikimate 1-carboxyvinyltransferase [Gemmatimonadetes bacterium]|nr:3-phosphoshikimate 1-carboxyvinyltransferase [Gemmatimonadota bacterium]
MIVGGAVVPPGDKSITHRALVLGALAKGTSTIHGALTAWDARSMAGVLRGLGVEVSSLRPGARVRIRGRGLQGFRAPTAVLDCGNSGTAARFSLGVLSGYRFAARITGDASLRQRPMRRVTVPLGFMGARFEEENGDGLPIVVRGGRLRSLTYDSPTASAQVKGALLFAGLVGGVPVTLTEPVRSRDHTERMLRCLGARLDTEGLTVRFSPPESLPAFEMQVPGDPSSAAFLVAAALLANAGQVEIRDVGANPTRTGYLRVLERMGAKIAVEGASENMGEPLATLVARPSALTGVEVSSQEVPSLIDEIPVLAVLASRARGESVFRGVQELRVKESDRLSLLAENLRAVGVGAEATKDSLHVRGTDAPPRGVVNTAKDHRLAMAFAVLNTVPGAAITLSETASVAVSYPAFFDDLARVGRW